MASFIVEGGHRLSGAITPQGAKNEALQVICATLLTDEEITIENIPDIKDVNNLIALLSEMGVEVNKKGEGAFAFKAGHVDLDFMFTERFLKKAAELRGSVMLIGPLLARYGQAVIPRLGGDKIGRRRIDTHLLALMKLGAELEVREENKIHVLKAGQLHGQYILLDEASVTGTANLLMAAVMAQGETVIYNAACEPYVEQLSRMLVMMGAHIDGIGSNRLIVNGVTQLNGCCHRLMPDMIEVGSFIGMAAMTSSELTIKDVSMRNLGIIPLCFRRLGIHVEQRGNDLYIPSQSSYKIENFMDGSILTMADAPWPGLTPDLLSVMLVVAIKATGCVLIHQKMFESRLFFVDKLIDMGAKIILCDPHRATVIGLGEDFHLRGTTLVSPDIRAGISLLIAAMSAGGTSTIHNIEQIDRGYQNIDKRLNQLGARITRVQMCESSK